MNFNLQRNVRPSLKHLYEVKAVPILNPALEVHYQFTAGRDL